MAHTSSYRSPRRYRLYSVGEILTMILEAPATYPLQIIDNTLVHRSAEHAVRVDVLWNAHRYQAIILTRSSDWYHFSLHLYAEREQAVDLVICGTHDSCLPLPLLSFDSLLAARERKDGPLVASPYPRWFAAMEMRWPIKEISDAFRKTEYGHNILLGALMCRLPEAYERLAQIPSPHTRLRISREIQRLQHRRLGHPVKVVEKVIELPATSELKRA